MAEEELQMEEGGGKGKMMIIIIAVVVLIAGGAAAFFFLGGDDTPVAEEADLKYQKSLMMQVVRQDQLQLEPHFTWQCQGHLFSMCQVPAETDWFK